METSLFYTLINDELSAILNDNPYDGRTKTHKNEAQNKSYALLVWFLRFYGQKEYYKSYITDGKDDLSCDIVFSNKNAMEEDIFYVVQSKYVNFDPDKKREDEFPKIKKEEFGSALNDFSVLLGGDKAEGQNEVFNKKNADLKPHLAKNGKAKFLFFTLAHTNPEINDSVIAFNKKYAPNVSLEIIDLERIKRDYIEFKYKEITTANPLEYHYSPENRRVDLNIERFGNSQRDIFEFEGRTKAFVFLLKPKTIHALFKKYKFSLFFKNVRNPLHRSNYNQGIVDTLLKKPDAFWYFNNGISAISKVLPEVGLHAKKISVTGLQVINGAQTVYSVYMAYEKANGSERKAMDVYAKIALRLIGSSDEDFNLQITRYTNMQNPMEERDFQANDAVQQRLQDESFRTGLWYEKRRDEFRLTKEEQQKLGIQIIENHRFARAYVSFHKQEPFYAIKKSEYFFISWRVEKNGLYEEIFNEKTMFEDMYASYFVLETFLEFILTARNKPMNEQETEWFHIVSAPIIALSRAVMKGYFAQTYPNQNGKEFNLNLHLFNLSKTKKESGLDELKKILAYSLAHIMKKIDYEGILKPSEMIAELKNNPGFYFHIGLDAERSLIDVEKIRSIDLKDPKYWF